MPESNVQKFNGAGQTAEERQAHLAQVIKDRAERNEMLRKIAKEHGLDRDRRDFGGGVLLHLYPPRT